jgi:hypothetical protein
MPGPLRPVQPSTGGTRSADIRSRTEHPSNGYRGASALITIERWVTSCSSPKPGRPTMNPGGRLLFAAHSRIPTSSSIPRASPRRRRSVAGAPSSANARSPMPQQNRPPGRSTGTAWLRVSLRIDEGRTLSKLVRPPDLRFGRSAGSLRRSSGLLTARGRTSKRTYQELIRFDAADLAAECRSSAGVLGRTRHAEDD